MTNLSAVIQRIQYRDDGTLGNLSIIGNPFTCYSLELSYRGNASGISCIPSGIYLCKWTKHPEHGWCWQVMGVEGRTDILIHTANLAGNTEQGYQKQVLGCIALGTGVGMFRAGQSFHVEGPHGLTVEPLTRDQRGITGSVDALAAFCKVMGTKDFNLNIKEPVLEGA